MIQRLDCRRPGNLDITPWWVGCLAFIITVCAVGPSYADDDAPNLKLGKPYLRGDHVWLDFTMSAMIRGQVLDALHSGLPATMVFEWRIWQRRDGWWDRQIDNGATFFRVFYDVLQNRYDVFDHRGRLIASSDDSEEIERVISDNPGLKLTAAGVLRADWKYYVEVHARIDLLDEEEVRNLKDWLAGTQGDNDGFNIVGALSERMAKMLGGVIGPNEKTVVGKTEDFSGF